MTTYRIYALIHGETLPSGKIFDCQIKKMSFIEQKRRKFFPIQSYFSKNVNPKYEKTYVTFLPFIDSVKIRSKYVVIYDIEEDSHSSALGGAVRAIDKLCRFLTLACVEDVKRKFGRERGNFEPYIYQVKKVYQLDSKGKEKDTKFKLESGFVYLSNRPEFTKWRDKGTGDFLKEMYDFDDEVLQRSLKYLYRSSVGFMLKDSPEKIALDHMKSIEMIIKKLSKAKIGKRRIGFKVRVEEAGNKIGLTPKEKDSIKNFWDERSTFGDIAHPSKFDEAEMYQNQFPIPSNTHSSGGAFSSVAPSVLLKYYQYIKGIYFIDIEAPQKDIGTEENTFCKIYSISMSGTTHQNHLIFYSSETDEGKLIKNLKTEFAKEYNIKEDLIVEIEFQKNKNKFSDKKFKLRICTTQ